MQWRCKVRGEGRKREKGKREEAASRFLERGESGEKRGGTDGGGGVGPCIAPSEERVAKRGKKGRGEEL